MLFKYLKPTDLIKEPQFLTFNLFLTFATKIIKHIYDYDPCAMDLYSHFFNVFVSIYFCHE